LYIVYSTLYCVYSTVASLNTNSNGVDLLLTGVGCHASFVQEYQHLPLQTNINLSHWRREELVSFLAIKIFILTLLHLLIGPRQISHTQLPTWKVIHDASVSNSSSGVSHENSRKYGGVYRSGCFGGSIRTTT